MQFVYKRLDSIQNVSYDLYGIGISMGANLLLRYQALYSDESRFKALISISNPFDIQLSANLMKETPFEPYIAWSAK